MNFKLFFTARNFKLQILLLLLILFNIPFSYSQITNNTQSTLKDVKIPDEVSAIIKRSQEYGQDLQKVVDHYIQKGDEQKLKAALFLISNSNDKYSIMWENRKDYQPLFNYVMAGANSNQALKKWDSLVSIFKVKKTKIKDIEVLTSEILINNIDLAFNSWKTMPWGKFYNFDQFCENILPYRVTKEPLENWRPFLYDKMKWVLDSLKNKNDIREACKFINDYVHKNHHLLPSLGEVPILGTIDAFNNPVGVCEDRLILIINILRTFGIPCTLDFTPQYANWGGGHSWVTLIDTTGLPISFSGGDLLKYPKSNIMPMGFGSWTATKVYRETFSSNNDFEDLFYKSCIDVTSQYDMPVGDINFQFKNVKEGEDVFLFTFGLKTNLIPVAITQCKEGSSSFKNIGLNSVYFPGIYDDNHKVIPLQNPFFIDSLNISTSYQPDKGKTQKVILTAKFPDDGSMLEYGQQILGAKIEGSNSESFEKPILLHKITNIPYHFVSIPITMKEKFRYVRYTASDSGFIRLAELHYYSDTLLLKGKMSGRCPNKNCNPGGMARLQDNNFYTVMNADGKSYVTVDFGEPKKLTKISFVQRSRINFIEPGSSYELFYFDLGWHSLGKVKASTGDLQVQNIPRHSLLVLVKPESKDNRIFEYDKNKQVWR